ncbi:hypothetical protein [Paeniglutamicibacter gangotriensis]|nr:hypothetical protein [Paeniglutamicibacter gangotriensis]
MLPASNDLFVHAATLEQLKSNFWAPRDPMVNEDGLGNPYFSPYMVFWAAMAKITGFGTFVVLRLGAIANLVLFLTGFGAFVGTLSDNRKAPVLSLAAVFFLWGTGFLYWSGFISFPSLIVSIAYPSTFALGMGLWLWVWLSRLLNGGRGPLNQAALVLAIAVGGSLVVLSHQFTAVGVCIYAGLYVLRHHRRIARTTVISFAVIVAVVMAATILWPWFNLLSSTGGVEGFNAVHKSLYTDLMKRYSLLLVAIPLLAHRLVKDKADPLVLTVLICLAVFIYGGISGNYFLARIFPPVALLSQIAVGIAVAQWLGRGRTQVQRFYAAAASLAILAGTLFQSGFVNLLVPGSYPAALEQTFGSRMTKGDYRWLTEHAVPGDSVMTTNWDARAMAPGYGIFTVMTAWPDPFLGVVEQQRRADSQEFFRASTDSRRRAELMTNYDAQWVIAVDDDTAVLDDNPQFRWVAERPDTGMREEDTNRGRQQLFEFIGK